MMIRTHGCSTFDRGACGCAESVNGALGLADLPRHIFDPCIDWSGRRSPPCWHRCVPERPRRIVLEEWSVSPIRRMDNHR